MRQDCRERFPRHRGLAIPTCITARASHTCRDACRDRLLAVSFEVGGGENAPGIPGACTTHIFYVSGKRPITKPWEKIHRPFGEPVMKNFEVRFYTVEMMVIWDAVVPMRPCADQSLFIILDLGVFFLLVTNHIHRNINAPSLILLTDLQNCTTIGFAGSEAKVAWLKELGYTHAFNYKTCNLGEVLKTAAPEGANVYIDHVSVPSIITIKFHGLFFHLMIGFRRRRWPRVINTPSAARFRGGFGGHFGWRCRIYKMFRNYWKLEKL